MKGDAGFVATPVASFEVFQHRDAPFAPENEYSLRSRIAVFVVIIQAILFLGHWFLYETFTAFFPTPDGHPRLWLEVTLSLLSISFVGASLLAWRSFDMVVRVLYSVAAVWMGILNFCFLGACFCWALWGAARLAGLNPDRRLLATIIFGTALAVSLYGIVNAAWTRVTRITVKLPNLPASWRGCIPAPGRGDHRYPSRPRSRTPLLAAYRHHAQPPAARHRSNCG
jgi:hypothetical protein